MKSIFSTKWKASKQPRKQRKYVYNAPSHIRKKLVSALLSKELREKHGKRNVSIRKGDKVKVMRGQFRNKTGEVLKVDFKNIKIIVDKVESLKRDGTKIPYPLSPSNLMIMDLKLDDKKRKKSLERK